MKFDTDKRYYLSNDYLHHYLREDWIAAGEEEIVVDHLLKKLKEYVNFNDFLVRPWDIELTYERELIIYCCYEGEDQDVEYSITIYPERQYRRR